MWLTNARKAIKSVTAAESANLLQRAARTADVQATKLYIT